MKRFIHFTTGILLFGAVIFSAKAAFTNIYVFGDALSASADTNTINPAPGPPDFYGLRRSNGRVWVEVLAQRLGLGANSITNVNWSYSTNNWSYFGNTSTSMVARVSSFTAPANASNALFIIWVNNADLFYPAQNNDSDMNAWTRAINTSLTNHFKAITNLYAKGARTLIMPNAVDLSTIPEFNWRANTAFIHQRCLDYNVAFTNILNRARTNSNYPGLTIYMPDFFTLLANIIAHPANYTVTNALDVGLSIDVIEDPALSESEKNANGPGTNHIFWDSTDPSAKVHAWMANTVQQLISPPPRISQFTALKGSNRLVMANVPVGQPGQVLGRTNLLLGNWTTNLNNINTTNPTQTVYVTNSGPQRFYRLKFLYSWTYP